MILRYEPIHGRQRGLLAAMLTQSHEELLRTNPDLWRPEAEKWDQFDQDAFDHPDTVGACVFLSSVGTQIVGFSSFDPRGAPEFGRMGHNCVLPEYRGRGFGKLQVQEILRRLSRRGIRVARVSTLSGAGYVPAQRMYVRCGFREIGRRPWDRDPGQAVIEYERALDLASGG